MNNPIILSTLFLTLLLIIGLFFFIKASVKDRTQQAQFISPETPENLSSQLKQYFAKRAYHISSIDSNRNVVTFEGIVRPSWFLAIFLTIVSGIGLLCLSLVLSIILPDQGLIFISLILLSPLTGVFYWKKSTKVEQVLLKLEELITDNHTQSVITLQGHRDELITLQQSFHLQEWEKQ